jgi:hypothetical protein
MQAIVVLSDEKGGKNSTPITINSPFKKKSPSIHHHAFTRFLRKRVKWFDIDSLSLSSVSHSISGSQYTNLGLFGCFSCPRRGRRRASAACYTRKAEKTRSFSCSALLVKKTTP